MGELDIVREEQVAVDKKGRSQIFRDIVWVWEIPSQKLLDVISLSVRRQLDTVENYAQFVARRLQDFGIVIEVESTISPMPDGYKLVLAFKLRGIRKDIVEKKLRILKRHAKDWMTASMKYKRLEKLIDRVMSSERAVGDHAPRASSEEAEEEGGGAEGERKRLNNTGVSEGDRGEVSHVD